MRRALPATAVLFLISGTSAAHDSQPLLWDCWVGGEPIAVHCIHDRDVPEHTPSETHDHIPAATLDRIHGILHGGNLAQLDPLLRDISVNPREGIWSITVYTHPYDETEGSARAEQLVRAVLCPPDVECAIHIRYR